MSDAFRLIDEGPVLVLEIDRPQTKNSLKLTEMEALGEMLASERVRDARCLVIRGAGDSFCSGRDVREINPEGEDAHEILLNRIGPILQRLYALPAPTLSAVRGPALGFGLGLALACDMTIASDDAIFGSPFRRIGAVLDSGGHYFFQHRLGRHRAAELVFTGRMLSGREAAAIGLINEAVPADKLSERTAELANLIASGPTAAFRATKDILSEDRSFNDVLALEARYQKEVTRGPDGQEGLAAFRERRKPVFRGR
ncbi:enoyl-CoA hydratase/isomerase family protein [Pseudorhodoplanes sp.]|jgi:2-(1,2-epoxy-1,2-dihydrophenyl)acetyl-CoA isomerase|uniref:enoyl-CoA hydratase/isomerase family protein n=1 Tax=Pseudorhodoplanes sp. TaxID=1934341 RepID=UPI002CD401EF|nr:enoyl-CoA hydratase-related protein [Pseudorhodoplanes sp.]HWV40952.1 enoyl-CoA hydratase-related protein [Pseudorhodoplanes sp.]